jgi:hypothetical protein
MSGGILPADHWISVNFPQSIEIFEHYFPNIIPQAVFGDNFDLFNFPRGISNEHMNDFIMYQREIVEYILLQANNRLDLQIAAVAAAWLRPAPVVEPVGPVGPVEAGVPAPGAAAPPEAAAHGIEPVPPGAAAPAAGGFKSKYLKYKQKYLDLKATLN